MKIAKLAGQALSICIICFSLFTVSLSHAESFEETALQLSTGSYSQKTTTIEALVELDDERVLPTLVAMQEARLFFQPDHNRMVIITKNTDSVVAALVNTAEPIGEVELSDLKKVRINNKLRRVLRPKIAILQLSSKDKNLRLESAKDLLLKPNPELREVINTAHENEESAAVKETLELALALIDIDGSDQKARIDALDVFENFVEPEVVAILVRVTEKNEEGNYLETNIKLAEKAEKILKNVNSKVSFFKFCENIVFGLSLGSILLLAAIGLAITFGVMGVINMAHGEMIMLGAYTTYAIQQLFPSMIDWSLLFALPAAFLVSGLAGVLIERLVIRHLYGRALDTLLATFGISLILQQAVRMYSANNVAVVTPEWLSGFLAVNGAMSLTYNRIYILIFSLIVLAVLALVLKKTMMGLQMRAVTQNRPMANSMGIRSGWVDALTFGLGSGIAGIAGVALSQITNVGPNLGQGYIIDSFMVVVFGGVGNLLGTFFGAMSLGLANKMLEPYAGAVVGKIIVLVFIILFIQWRPRGLFALKGRFVDD